MAPLKSTLGLILIGYAVLAAAIAIGPAMLVRVLTETKFPRVSAIASGIMCASFGIVVLWVIAPIVDSGVFEKAEASRMFKTTVLRSEAPVAFWVRVAFFAVPAALLILIPAYATLKSLAGFAKNEKPAVRKRVGSESGGHEP